MPVLDAMANSVPVITSRRSALPEVAGDAALLVNPEDTEEIAAALVRLASDEALVRRPGPARARARFAVFLGVGARQNLGRLQGTHADATAPPD